MRRVAILVLSLALPLLTGCSSPSQLKHRKIPVDETYIIPGVHPQRQKSSMACWITCAAILKSWRDGLSITPEQLAARMGEPWKIFFDTDSGLPREDYQDFAKSMGLKFEWPANWIPAGYVDLLKRHGPLWIAWGVSSHARILYGVATKNDRTIMLFIDPATGTAREEDFAQFFPEFEAEAKLIVGDRPELDLPIQILHY